MQDTPTDPMSPRAKEPMFNILFLPMLAAVGLVALYAVQGDVNEAANILGFRPTDLGQGHYTGLITHMIVHGSWMHVLMNSVGIIAFGAPVARDLSRGVAPLAWIALFIVCGIAGALGYAVVNMGNAIPMIGASGALFGLIGASLRLMAGPGILIPLFHPMVIRSAIAWLAVTVLVGLAGGVLAGDSARVAWEAHLFGFLAGIVLIGPIHALCGLKHPPLRG